METSRCSRCPLAKAARAALGPLVGGVWAGVLATWLAAGMLERVSGFSSPTLSGYATAAELVLALALITLVGPALRVAGKDPVSLLRSD